MSSFTSSHGWAFLEINLDTWKFQLKHQDVSAELIFSSGGAYRSGQSIKSLDGKSVLELKMNGNLVLSENGRPLLNIQLPVVSYNALSSYIEGLPHILSAGEVLPSFGAKVQDEGRPEMCRTNVLHVYDYVLVSSII